MAELLFDSEDAAPEALRPLLVKRGEKLAFAFETPDKVKEFRDNNIRLAKERDELAQRFDGIDPEAAKQALAKVQELTDKELIDSGKLDELVKQRAERELHRLRGEFEPKLKQVTTERDAYESELGKLRAELEARDLSDELVRAAGEKKIKPNKLPYLKSMAQHGDAGGVRWARKDGRMVAVRGDETLEITFGDWIDSLVKADPDLVIPSSGGGALGGTGGAGNHRAKDTTGLSPMALISRGYAS